MQLFPEASSVIYNVRTAAVLLFLCRCLGCVAPRLRERPSRRLKVATLAARRDLPQRRDARACALRLRFLTLTVTHLLPKAERER